MTQAPVLVCEADPFLTCLMMGNGHRARGQHAALLGMSLQSITKALGAGDGASAEAGDQGLLQAASRQPCPQPQVFQRAQGGEKGVGVGCNGASPAPTVGVLS